MLRIADPRVAESSGLAASARHAGILWTHNDSGDFARIYAIGPDGRTRAVIRLAGQRPRDWEAIAAGPAGTLWIGDIGDNSGRRTAGILVHRIEEPARLVDQTARVTSYRLRYPDGPHDAEALLVDPRSGQLLVATKSVLSRGGLYRAPLPLRPVTAGPNDLRRIGTVPRLITDGTFLRDGRFVLRDYGFAYVYADPTSLEARVPLPSSAQGESVTATADGRALLVGSEGANSPVWSVPLPIRPAPATPLRRVRTYWPAVVAAIAAAAIAAGVLAVRRRGSRSS